MLGFICRALSGANGADQLAVDIITGIARAGQPVTVLTQDRAGMRELSSSAIKAIVPPQKVPFPAQLNAKFARRFARWAKWSLYDINAARLVRQLVLEHAFINDLGNDDLWRSLPIERRPQATLVVHTSPRHFGGTHQAKSLDWALDRISSYSGLIFVSQRCREEWISYPGLSSKRTFYIPNCCNEPAVQSVRAKNRAQVRSDLGLPLDKFVGVCVASLQHRKGQDLLIDRLEALVSEVPDLLLCFIGSSIPGNAWVNGGEQYARDLQTKLAPSRHSDRARFYRYQKNALDFIYAADFLVLPARAEAMPITILEAMALGTPVIASAVDGIPEMIRDRIDGRLFDVSSPDLLIQAISEISSDESARTRYSCSAKQRYWSEFSRERLIARYAEVASTISRC